MRDLKAGDFLVFQLEAGYGLLRIIGIDEIDGSRVWHLAAYNELFQDIEFAETAIEAGSLSLSHPHLALTERAFESTQSARLSNSPVLDEEAARIDAWREGEAHVSDRSVRLLLGLR